MTLTILFLTVTIKKRAISTNEYVHENKVQRMEDENRNRMYQMLHMQRMY
ncbi:MAG TPA: YrzI family small protein [Pseudoneobacillus sp.]|nr:YrzI family small protein [Pseudoneobacillus sp.]